MNVRRLIPILLLLVACCFTSCSKGPEKVKAKARPPAPVITAPVTTQTVPVVVEATGTTETPAQVAVKSMVNGEVTQVHFVEGQDVVKGQLLFTIDPRQYDALIKKGEADLVRIKAQLATARANAERYGKLVKDGIVTVEQFDGYRTQAESLEADSASQQATIDALRVQRSYCSIRSPISGRTGNLLIHGGNLVKANDTVSLVTINQIRPIYVSFAIPERDLSRVRSYMVKGRLKVEARLPGDSGPPETGEVSFLDNAVDAATATIKLKGTFANPKSRLWPGQFVAVRLNLASLADALTVPSQAVQTGQQGEFVYVVNGDTAELRPVKTGTTFEGRTVIEQGLKPGETVVIDGHLRVVPGGKVTTRTGASGDVKGGSTAGKPAGSGAAAGPARQ